MAAVGERQRAGADGSDNIKFSEPTPPRAEVDARKPRLAGPAVFPRISGELWWLPDRSIRLQRLTLGPTCALLELGDGLTSARNSLMASPLDRKELAACGLS